jgi:hypothetical protein
MKILFEFTLDKLDNLSCGNRNPPPFRVEPVTAGLPSAAKPEWLVHPF